MGLGTKFNLVLFGTFVIGLVAAAALTYQVLQDFARDSVLGRARVMMDTALAVRDYTTSEIRPLLEDRMDETFLPHTVPSFAAQENLRRMVADYPDYAYKEAALNPTNPADRATDWEADIITVFRNDQERRELVTIRDTPTGQSLVLARPLVVNDESCLTCHSTVQEAPSSMLAKYGPSNGFGWELNEVIGAQVVSVPMSVPLERAWTTFLIVVGALAGVFLVVAILLNVLLRVLVIRPVVRLSGMAVEVSLGNMDVPDVRHGARDEIGALSEAFTRMRRSLETALTMLKD